jgi:hypothetical protein
MLLPGGVKSNREGGGGRTKGMEPARQRRITKEGGEGGGGGTGNGQGAGAPGEGAEVAAQTCRRREPSLIVTHHDK